MQVPPESSVRRWYQQHLNAGLFALLAFMGLDSSEVEAQGWTVTSADGRLFIDCLGGYGSLNFGHRHPRIIAAVKEQLDRLALSAKILLNTQAAALAHELAELVPGELSYVFFSNSGTEAVEAALKLARLSTGRPGVISAKSGFHGKTLGSLSSTMKEDYQAPFRPLIGHFDAVPFGDANALDEAVDAETAAVILEPVQGEGGINVAPPGYLPAVREITRKAGALLIIDEVQTGMGRTGRNFACEFENIEPDLLVLAKSLGGGVMPIGATLGTPAVWKKFEEHPLIHSSTFGGNELACAAARAALAVLQEEQLAAQAAAAGEYFLSGLRTLARRFPDLIAEVRGIGLMIGIEMVSGDASELFIANIIEQRVLVAFALNQPGVIRIEPPLIMPLEVIDEVLHRLERALELTRQIFKQFGTAEP